MNKEGHEIKILKQEIDSDESVSALSTQALLTENYATYSEDDNTAITAIVKDEIELTCDANIKIENMAYLNENTATHSSSNECPSFEEVIIKEEKVDLGQNEGDTDVKLSAIESAQSDWCGNCGKVIGGIPNRMVTDACKCCTEKSGRITPSHSLEKSYACNICNKIFTARSFLTVHKRTHTNETPYKCHVCHRSFRATWSVTMHMRTHTNEKPYQCEVCERTFSQSSQRTRHMRTHTNEKPYKCDVCARDFSDSSSQLRHARTHTAVKPYVCRACGKTFSDSSTVVRHMRTHTNEKPYKCGVCERTFSQSSSLSKHALTHTDERPYECRVCGRRFRQSTSLTRHMRTHSK